MGVRHPVGERRFFGSGASNFLKLALFSYFFVFVAHFLVFLTHLGFIHRFVFIFLDFSLIFLDFGQVSGRFFDDF